MFLVNFYYTHYWFFAYCCVGAETVYLVRAISPGSSSGSVAAAECCEVEGGSIG